MQFTDFLVHTSARGYTLRMLGSALRRQGCQTIRNVKTPRIGVVVFTTTLKGPAESLHSYGSRRAEADAHNRYSTSNYERPDSLVSSTSGLRIGRPRLRCLCLGGLSSVMPHAALTALMSHVSLFLTAMITHDGISNCILNVGKVSNALPPRGAKTGHESRYRFVAGLKFFLFVIATLSLLFSLVSVDVKR